jgi:hypothetical protein
MVNRGEFMSDEILVPEEDLESEEDKFGFKIFTKALFCLLKLDEGVVVEDDGELYVVHRFKDEESGEELMGIQKDPSSPDGPLRAGMMVWLDLDKPPEERHTDFYH